MLQTDYKPLKYMNSAKFANDASCVGLCVGLCFFRVGAIKGSGNVGADYLSRVEEYLKRHWTTSSLSTI